MKIKWLALVAVATFASSAQAQSLRIDCSNPASSSEELVCSDGELGRRYGEVEAAYLDLRRSADEGGVATLDADQRTWMRNVENCGNSAACVRSQIEYRTNFLAQASDPRPAEATATSAPAVSEQPTTTEGSMSDVTVDDASDDGVSNSLEGVGSETAADVDVPETDDATPIREEGKTDDVGRATLPPIDPALLLVGGVFGVLVLGWIVKSMIRSNRNANTCGACGHHPVSRSSTDEPKSTYTKRTSDGQNRDVYEVGIRKATTSCPGCGRTSQHEGRYERRLGRA